MPVHQLVDSKAAWRPDQIGSFWSHMWPEAVRDFAACGIRLESTVKTCEVHRSPGGRPIFKGLDHGVLNFVITDQIPLNWDRGRGLAGVATRNDGYDLCVIALFHAHGHQVPLLSVNTCVHELLHALLLDIVERRPEGWHGQTREFRIDWYATRMWLFHDGAAVRESVRAYLNHLRST